MKVVKILLNSLFGALLNAACKYYDERLGQTTTLTGRSIARHMNAMINELITGCYDYKGQSVIYSDTDSSYFSAYEYMKDRPEYAGIEWTRETVVELYDEIANDVNASFAGFMTQAFNTTPERGQIIQAGRELVASRGLFIKKKKYAVLMFDKEGERLDKNGKPGKLKAMGLDLKRADTPKYMQEFLENLLMNILTGAETEAMFEDIRQFRDAFKDRPGWEKGTPKKINGYSHYEDADRKARTAGVERTIKKGEKTKVNMPGHVRAAINWNVLCDINQDRYAMRLSDGAKAVVCKLRPNVYNMDSVAYPIDETHLPEWYRALPFDDTAMEETIIDFKLENLVGVLGWDLSRTKNRDDDEFFVFG